MPSLFLSYARADLALVEPLVRDLAALAKRATTPDGRPEPLDFGRAIKDWAMTQNNLARAVLALKDWPTAVASYASVQELYPEYEEAYRRAGWLYHEVLFNFPAAFTLNQRWLERHPDDFSTPRPRSGSRPCWGVMTFRLGWSRRCVP